MAAKEPECSICYEVFDGQAHCPRLLSCGHTLCSRCIDRLIKENAINCPTCRNTVPVATGAAALPKNFALLDILENRPKNSNEQTEGSRMCETCEEEQHPATSCCLDCKEDMCGDAARFHSRQKATRDHHVVSLKELKANPNLAAVVVFCPEHNDRYRHFDEDCGHAICADCLAHKHNGHRLSSLAEAASKYRKDIVGLTTTVSFRAKEIKTAEATAEVVSLQLKQEYEKQAAQIRGIFEELHAALSTREQDLTNKLSDLYTIKSATLTEQRDCLRVHQACLESAILRAQTAVQSQGDAGLLVSGPDIVSTLKTLMSQPLVLKPQEDSKLEFFFDCRKLLDAVNGAQAGVISSKFSSPCNDVSSVSPFPRLPFPRGRWKEERHWAERACANAATTTAAGMGLKLARLGKKASFIISAHDHQDRPCRQGGDAFVADFIGKRGKMVEVDLRDNGDGTYYGTYTVPVNATDDYTLSVLLHSVHIQGSPFSVLVVGEAPVGKVSCFSCGRRNSKMNYYLNDDVSSSSHKQRVDGYSALCYPECLIYSYQDQWKFVCGPV